MRCVYGGQDRPGPVRFGPAGYGHRETGDSQGRVIEIYDFDNMLYLF